MMDDDQATAPLETEVPPPADEQSEVATDKAKTGKGLDAIFAVQLEVRVVLGRNQMPISELLDLTKGSVIELDRRVGEPVDLMINDRMVARGDLVRVQGDMLGVALREIVKDFVSET